MALTGGADLLLFVSVEPGSGDEPQWTFLRWLAGTRMSVRLERWRSDGRRRTAEDGSSNPSPPPEGPPWHLPRQEIPCVNLVLEMAHREGRIVTLVDANRAGEQQDLVHRWVGPDDVLPLLVRPDGGRLEGPENFVPQKVRQFISGP